MSETITLPIVTVITAAYNAENFIAETIKSVQNQTFQNWQYIIADNGSTDNTANIIKQFLNDKRIEYIFVPKRGKTIARNTAFSLSKGIYIANIDSDDLWREDKLAKQIYLIEKNIDMVLVYTAVLMFNQSQNVDRIKIPVDLSKNLNPLKYLLTVGNPITHSSVLIRRESFINNFYQHEEIEKVDEQIIYWKALLFSNKVGFIPEVLTKYRVHNKSEFENIPIDEFCQFYKKGIDTFFKLPNLSNEIICYRKKAYGAMYYASGTVGLSQCKSIKLSFNYLLKSCMLRPNKIHYCIITFLWFLINIIKKLGKPSTIK